MTVALLVGVLVLLLLVLGGTLVATTRRRGRRVTAPPPPPPPPLAEAPAQPVAEPEVERAPEPAITSEAVAVEEAPAPAEVLEDQAAVAEAVPDAAPETPVSLRRRLRSAVAALGTPFAAVRSRGRVDQATFDELEEALLLADVGLPTTNRLLEPLRAAVRAGTVEADSEALIGALKDEVVGLFEGEDRSLDEGAEAPSVWLIVGVNGVGKTTTIGKLAAAQRRRGRVVVLAAGDTFRAAAAEQLELWAERTDADMVRGAEGADPSSVVFDAVQHAAASHADLVLADTAGRLHTRTNLMEELGKVRRVADRPPGHVTEVLLVLDATTGQNGLVQAREFAGAVGVTGIVLTKLDGTAKGGIVLAVRAELALPIKLVGLGEGPDDLVEFDPEEFAAALFD